MGLGMKLFLLYLIIVNIIAFVVMGVDKYKAKKKKWRIPEKVLFLWAILGGSIGAMYGMHLFRHKTKHKSFRYGIPAICIVESVAVIVWLLG